MIRKLYHAMRGDGCSVARKERVWAPGGRASLRQEEGGHEEGMGRKLNNSNLSLGSHAADDHPARLKLWAVLGIDAVVTVVAFGDLFNTVEHGRACLGYDGDRLRLADERARKGRDQQARPLRVGLCVIGVLKPKDVARELNDRVLKTSSGPDQRHATLARIADRIQGPLHATVGTSRGDPQPVKWRQALCWIAANAFRRYPRKAETNVSQSLICNSMRRIGWVEVADNADQRTNHCDHRGSILRWLQGCVAH